MNAAEPQLVAEQESKAKRIARIADADVCAIMNEQTGRRFVYRILEWAGVYRLSYTGNSETFFNEGARNLGLKLLADLQRVTPKQYLKMLEEHFEQELDSQPKPA
jgi:hypothetical protein